MFKVTAPLWIGVILGALIGGFAELWGIANPETLIRLARWKDRLFIGCVAIASAVGAIALYLAYALGLSMHFSPKPVYIFGVVIGGLLFGAGMAVSGYVPGSEWMALGEGRRDALYAVAGGVLGAAAWTLLYQTSLGHWLVTSANYGSLIATGTIKHIHPWPTFEVAVAYAVVLLAIAFFLPRFKGGKHSCIRHAATCEIDVKDQEYMSDTIAYLSEGGMKRDPHNWFTRIVLSDVQSGNFYSRAMMFVGFIIGILVVLGIFLHQIFGESTTYSWFAGRLLLPNYKYSLTVFKTIGWEPYSDIGTFFGAFISAVFVSRRFNSFRPIVPPTWRNRFGNSAAKRAIGSFVGFFFVLFGARMADGCASGHILSVEACRWQRAHGCSPLQW